MTEFDRYGEAFVKLLYDGVGYRKLIDGVAFNIVEGISRIVGTGYVINR